MGPGGAGYWNHHCLTRICSAGVCDLVLRQVASQSGVNQIALAKRWPVQAIRFAQKATGKINRAEATPQSTRCNHGQLFKCWANADRKSTRLNSSHLGISYAVFC